ncbi:MAG: PLDc N-terminal domain-containing protein [Bacteroidales bacterium]|nr:PLDc N-terminal domain-containing protein [Bacteroidales bacterium]MCQ2141325.1 PLDc N-terminal domain-containing protein [Bacteroidales bacterium]
MGKIVWLLGVIAAVWCVLDIFKRPWDLVKKIIVAVLVLAFSWVGFIVYYLIKEKL